VRGTLDWTEHARTLPREGWLSHALLIDARIRERRSNPCSWPHLGSTRPIGAGQPLVFLTQDLRVLQGPARTRLRLVVGDVLLQRPSHPPPLTTHAVRRNLPEPNNSDGNRDCRPPSLDGRDPHDPGCWHCVSYAAGAGELPQRLKARSCPGDGDTTRFRTYLSLGGGGRLVARRGESASR